MSDDLAHLSDEELLNCGCETCLTELDRRQPPEFTSLFTPMFQPNFAWTEKGLRYRSGVTSFDLDRREAEISAPDSDSPEARAIRLHEALHARFTPEVLNKKRPHDLSFSAEQIAEDVRLAHIARERGLFDDPDLYFTAKAIAQDPKRKAREEYALIEAALYMAAYGQPMQGWDSRDIDQFQKKARVDFAPKIKEVLERWGNLVAHRCNKPDCSALHRHELLCYHTQQTLLQVATLIYGADRAREMLTKLDNAARCSLSQKALPPRFIPGPPGSGIPNLQGEYGKITTKPGKGKARGGRMTVGVPVGVPARNGTRYDVPLDPSDYYLGTSDKGWGIMETRLAPLQRNFKALTKRQGVASPEGPIPNLLHRWYGDKQIFERPGRRRGGTLLIDISGSMGWAWEATKKLIEQTPAMTIALYSGTKTVEENDRPSGALTIIARQGRLVAENFEPYAFNPLHCGGNVVDGPALAWLVKQPCPRVWFSDGNVTGFGESGSQGLIDDAQRLCRLGGIHRTQETKTVLNIFLGRAKGETKSGGKSK